MHPIYKAICAPIFWSWPTLMRVLFLRLILSSVNMEKMGKQLWIIEEKPSELLRKKIVLSTNWRIVVLSNKLGMAIPLS